jgi:hypothetical protein
MFESLLGIAADVTKIVTAPLQIALDTTRIVTKPLGDVADAAAKEVKQAVKDLTQ